jgi:large subunit ribosomal protein L16
MPRRVKYRKTQRGRIKGHATRGTTVEFGEFGLQALEPAWITARQIEAARVAITHFLSREGHVYLRVYPQKSVSGKPAETRMGKGKGEPEYWVAVVKPGTVLYEIGGVPDDMAKEALNRAAHKLPIRVRLCRRRRAL